MGHLSNYLQKCYILWQDIKNRTQNRYYDIVPYEWRPSQIFSSLKDNLWHKHTTVKPRSLGNNWCDIDHLMSHTMFELLSRFIEDECSPGHVRWYGEGGFDKFDFNGKHKYIMDELLDLYYWWNFVYLKEYKEVEEILWKEIDKNQPDQLVVKTKIGYLYNPTWFNKRQDEIKDKLTIYKICFKAMNKLEIRMEKDLNDRMKRLVDVRRVMWT